jgi:hypothetical protein
VMPGHDSPETREEIQILELPDYAQLSDAFAANLGGRESAELVLLGWQSDQVVSSALRFVNGGVNTDSVSVTGDPCWVTSGLRTPYRADFDGNGVEDVLFYKSFGADLFCIIRGAEDSASFSAVARPAPHQSEGRPAGDFNGDGKSDFVVQDFTDPERIRLSTNVDDAVPTFEQSTRWPAPVSAAAAGDMDRDGFADLVAAYKLRFDEFTINVVYGNASAALSTISLPIHVGGTGTLCTLHGDFDADGLSDALISQVHDGGLEIYLLWGNADRSVAPEYSGLGCLSSLRPLCGGSGEPRIFVLGDVTGDLYPEIAIIVPGQPGIVLLQ